MTAKPIIDQEYLKILHQDCIELNKLCAILNNSPAFLKKVQDLNGKSNISVKAEHIILQDFINLFYRIEKTGPENNNPKSRFTLAYYFESLKTGTAADSVSKELDSIINSKQFEIKIKEVLQTVSNNYNTPNIYTILKQINSDHSKEIHHHFFKFINHIIKSDDKVNAEEQKLIDEILSQFNQYSLYNNEKENDTLELALADLNELIGLEEVKAEVKLIINFLQIQKERVKEKLPKISNSLHSVFIGPPGTGKTSVARILSRIYKHIGLLEKGHLIETDRAGLVAGYVGQTAIKVDEIINKALGGVLFIDEAYSLASNNAAGNDFGKEVLEILLKRMEDHRDKFIVIVAGYPDEMKNFIESNPGLKSRFNQYISFKHYTPEELFKIFKFFCSKYQYVLSKDAETKIQDIFELADDKKTDSYGNAREARNLFEKILRIQANRLVGSKELNSKILSEIIEEDVPPVKETVAKMTAYGNSE